MNLGSSQSPKSLERGMKLLNLEAKAIQTSPEANVRAAGAILKDCKTKTLGAKKAAKDQPLLSYHKVLKCFASSGDKFTDQLFADEIFSTLQHGATHRMPDGEVITIEAKHELKNFEAAPLKF